MNPKTNEIVFALINELIAAFQPNEFHVGMDEVFQLHSEHAHSTKKLDPADVFAKVVNDLHAHIVDKHGLTMIMWADRLSQDVLRLHVTDQSKSAARSIGKSSSSTI